MLVTVNCTCGKRIGVSDALAGRTVRCPKCGDEVLVKAAAAPAGKGAGKGAGPAAKQTGASAPAVAVSPTLITAGVVAALVLAVALPLYFGPWRVGNDWAAMAPKAGTDVTDVVMFALQAHQSQAFAPASGADVTPSAQLAIGKAPAIEGPANFIPPVMAFTMPRHVLVTGRTSQGGYRGTYDTTDGEVTLDVDTGGYSVGGLVDMHKATGSMHVTGREKDGQVTAEADGTPLKIYVPKYRGRHGELGD